MSDTHEHGGAAFPRPASKGTNYITGEEDVVIDPSDGMSMRDYFAGQIIAGMMARRASDEMLPIDMAERAYGNAWAMCMVRDRIRRNQR